MHVYWNQNCINGPVPPLKVIRIVFLLTTCEYQLLHQADRRFAVVALVFCTVYLLSRM